MLKTFNKLIICLLITGFVCIFSGAFLPIAEQGIYDNIIRLHVIANSDSESDQKIKLAVRDAILKKSPQIFENIDIDTAKKTVIKNEALLKKTAEAVLKEYNFDYNASVALSIEDYPTREYEGLTLPCGKYYSLQVVLGEGNGKNWWCVLFPPLCMGASTKINTIKRSGNISVFTKPKPVFRFKFKILELFN
ncbi:MAG: stage II sporulation protein R [Clostridia bacterium]